MQWLNKWTAHVYSTSRSIYPHYYVIDQNCTHFWGFFDERHGDWRIITPRQWACSTNRKAMSQKSAEHCRHWINGRNVTCLLQTIYLRMSFPMWTWCSSTVDKISILHLVLSVLCWTLVAEIGAINSVRWATLKSTNDNDNSCIVKQYIPHWKMFQVKV